MIIEIIQEHIYYTDFMNMINKLGIRDSILLVRVNDNSISVFVLDDEFRHNSVLKISDYFKLVMGSVKCDLRHDDITYYGVCSYKYEINIDDIRNIRLDELFLGKDYE